MCEWKIDLPSSVLLQLSDTHTHTHADITCLHCSAHMVPMSHTDRGSEDIWCSKGQEKDRLQLDWLYWNDVNCAVSVKLPD